MLSSITPLGERGRQQRWSVTAGAYVAGSALGGAALGLGLGAAGALLLDRVGSARALALGLVGALAFVGLAIDLAAARFRAVALPGPHRQVNEHWLDDYRGWVYGAGFGAQLGTGIVTIVTGSITYVVWLCALLSGSAIGGLVVGVVFGTVRALPIVFVRRVHDPATLRRFMGRLQQGFTPVRIAALGAQAGAVLATGVLIAGGS